MKGTYIGELGELVLLIIGLLYEGAYGVSVLKEIKAQTGREVNITGLHSVMNRLEGKGLLKSEMGGTSNTRGGRHKRIYYLSDAGKATLDQVRPEREKLYNQLPSGVSYSFSS